MYRKLNSWILGITILVLFDALVIIAIRNLNIVEQIAYRIVQVILVFNVLRLIYGIYLRVRGDIIIGYLCDVEDLCGVYRYSFQNETSFYTAKSNYYKSSIKLSIKSQRKPQYVYGLLKYIIVSSISSMLLIRSKDVHILFNKVIDMDVPDISFDFSVITISRTLICIGGLFCLFVIYEAIRNLIVISFRKKVEVRLIKKSEQVVTEVRRKTEYEESDSYSMVSRSGIALYECSDNGQTYYIIKEYNEETEKVSKGYASRKNYEDVVFLYDVGKIKSFLKTGIIFLAIGLAWELGYLSKVMDFLDELSLRL